jgi:putative transposase
VREERQVARAINESWSMDFMSDQLFKSGRIRLVTLVDNFSRESLAIEIGKTFTGNDVVRIIEKVCQQRGYPQTISLDYGPEFISKSLDMRAYCQKVKLDLSRPCKPTDNAIIESFNGKFREECLDQHWFLSLEEATQIFNAWRHDHNHDRPHSALGKKSPIDFFSLQACGLAHMPVD